MKEQNTPSLSAYYLCMIVAFIGILLSFLLFHLVDLSIETSLAPTCYDGSVIEGESFAQCFIRDIYQGRTSLALIKEHQYRLFGTVSNASVVAGNDGFLFEVSDPDSDYHYFEDYKGRLSFSDEELAAILESLEATRLAYAERDTEYLLVILPNAQSVYSNNMPFYMGEISDNTRLSALEDYLLEHGFTSFANLTDELREYKKNGQLYNNTDNSLNALGFYYAYLCVCARFDESVMENTEILQYDKSNFYQHTTTGKEIAQLAGLESVVQNNTVSLSSATKLHYRFVWDTGSAAKSFLPHFNFSVDVASSPALLIQCTDPWVRAQIEPFFSNTFRHVTYQTDLVDDPEIFERAAPRVVIRFVQENDLATLLDAND